MTHRERTEPEWVDTWVCTPQPTEPANLPPPPFAAGGRAFAGTTLRQTVRASIGGHRVRLCLSNAFGGTALPVTAVSVALPAGGRAGVSAIRPATSRPVTFGGRPSVRVPAGGQVASDPLELGVAAGSNLAVTMYLAGGQPAAGVTSHPGSRTTSYLLAGEHLRDPDLPGATPTDHWYFLSGLQVPAPPRTAVAVMVGDSLTDGRGSTTNQNNRWPDRLFDRLQSTPDTGDVAVLNHGVGGSRLLDDGQGPGTLDRLVAGVLARPALRWLVLFTGVNDIGTAEPTQAAQRRVAAELVAAYDQIATRVRRQGVAAYGATLPPFGGNAGYDDPASHRDGARRRVNEWIRTAGLLDGVVDFDLAAHDPADPGRPVPPAPPHSRSWSIVGPMAATSDQDLRPAVPLRRHLLRVRDLMDRAYAQQLDLRALARSASVSPSYFSRSFKAAFGETPHQYLMSRRMERAKALLRAGELSVTEVCLAVGFTSLGSFSTQFRRFVGESPSAYRERADHAALARLPSCYVRMWTRPRA